MMNKETIKEFLKPDWRKIVALIFLFLINLFLIETRHPIMTLSAAASPYLIGVYGWTEYYGIPLPFYTIAFIAGYGLYSELNPLFLTFDFFLWYLLACLIVKFYDNYLSKK